MTRSYELMIVSYTATSLDLYCYCINTRHLVALSQLKANAVQEVMYLVFLHAATLLILE